MAWKTRFKILFLLIVVAWLVSGAVRYHRKLREAPVVVEKKIEPKVSDDCWGMK